MITNEMFKIVESYEKSFKKRDSYFYRSWNVKSNNWSSQRRGERFFQTTAKEIASKLKLKDSHLYSHHSFRRSLASSLHLKGATRQQIKRAGGWRNDLVPEMSIRHSKGKKENCRSA